MRRTTRIIAVALVLILMPPLTATTVKIANLQELVEQSNRILVARCVDSESDASTQVPFTRYTFEVIDRIKGPVGNRVVFKQFGLAEPVPVSDGEQRVARVPGMPVYEPGQEVLLFMVEESPIGLSSPVGLGQGVFRVVHYGGKKVLVNEIGNRNLGNGLDVAWLRAKGLSDERASQIAESAGGPLDYDSFIATLKTIARAP